MYAPQPLVRTAERAGGTAATQERIHTTPQAVIVLDGASQPEPSDRDGGWYAKRLGRELAQALTADPDAGLGAALREAIAAVADRFSLSPGTSPSSTVCILRWTDTDIDALILDDSPIVVRTMDGEVHDVRDDRLSQLDGHDAYRKELAAGGVAMAHFDVWRLLVCKQRSANRPGGYWIAEATPEAAEQAVWATWFRALSTRFR